MKLIRANQAKLIRTFLLSIVLIASSACVPPRTMAKTKISCGAAIEGPAVPSASKLAEPPPAYSPDDASASAKETEWQRTELYFGLSIPGGGAVSEDEWSAFVGREICARFPAGFTIMMGDGEWRSPSGEMVSEQTRILLLLHPRSARNDSQIESIRSLYRGAFHQDSVLRVDGPVQISF
jgi:hypothetical protein